MPMKIRVDSKQNKTLFSRSWKMGSCTGPTGRTKYTSIGTYIDRCCQPPGSYTLTCKNDKGPFGWGNSFIEIQGMRYCDDFFGSEAFRRVLIKGHIEKTEIVGHILISDLTMSISYAPSY